ncbi:cytochrome c biogenesis protein [Ectothiorhodospira magna]|uniref:Cytochrome c biogenesis protein n=1 Tax=Ectothiorhodospira magna TaxID=867345 RepID=A0A1H9D7S8_9GAMM|nr:cytochrome c biogenesis protein ResB [Ectothiorhodospira magna]SEQ09552.1 cytochrome c biogenesis protein [Ectothiorhodospira magna]
MSSTPSDPPPGRRSTFAVLMGFLGSMGLAITLLVALAVASIVGTVLQQNQPYTTYLLDYGPFWHELFRTLGLYHVYSAAWYLLILVFLVISTSVCVYRSTPAMIRDMNQFRLGVKEKSLRSFQHNVQRNLHTEAPAPLMARAEAVFRARGYRVRQADHGDHQVLSAMRGSAGRLGYFFTHVAIVVICVGGLIDGRLPLMLAEFTGQLEIETRQVPVSEIPEQSRVSPANPSFRGSVEIPEGQRADVAFITIRNGYVVQELPFYIEVKAFRVERHATGQERAFETDLVIHDDMLDEPLAHTISVNHPLTYRGYTLYQASFRDGGSRLGLSMYPLGRGADRPLPLPARIFGTYSQTAEDGSRLRVEFTDFSDTNLTLIEEHGVRQSIDMGPSFEYVIRDSSGAGRFYRNFQQPFERDGRMYLLSGVREDPADPFSFLYIPLDPQGGVDRFMTFLAKLSDPDVLRAVVDETTRTAAGQFEGVDEQLRTQVADTMLGLLETFAVGGYDEVIAQVQVQSPEGQWDRMADIFLRVLNAGLDAIYLRVLAQEGIEVVSEADDHFLDDALRAINALPFYGSPFFLHLNDFDHIQASGLMITKAPGQGIVYAGSVMLILGIFLLLYVSHRRCWVWIRPGATGTDLVLAGTSNRNMSDFNQEFDDIAQAILGDSRPLPADQDTSRV